MERRTTADRSIVALDAVEPIVLRHNRWCCDHGWDVDLDDGSRNYIIKDNLMLSGGLKFREGFDRIARNNILVNNSFHPHVWFANSADVFERNIVMTAYQPIRVPVWGKSVDNNLFPDKAALARAQAAGTDRHSTYGQPDFVSPKTSDFFGAHGFAVDESVDTATAFAAAAQGRHWRGTIAIEVLRNQKRERLKLDVR